MESARWRRQCPLHMLHVCKLVLCLNIFFPMRKKDALHSFFLLFFVFLLFLLILLFTLSKLKNVQFSGVLCISSLAYQSRPQTVDREERCRLRPSFYHSTFIILNYSLSPDALSVPYFVFFSFKLAWRKLRSWNLAVFLFIW